MLEIVTDRAVSPLEIKVMTLDAVPLGQQPTKIRPAASIGDNPSTLLTQKAINGMIR